MIYVYHFYPCEDTAKKKKLTVCQSCPIPSRSTRQSAACLTALVEASVLGEKCSTGRKASWPPGGEMRPESP